MTCKYLLGLLIAVGSIHAAELPSFTAVRTMLRKDHPRMFLTKETLGDFRQRANTVCKKELEALRQHVEALPDHPRLELKYTSARWEGDKLVFVRSVTDHNEIKHVLRNAGGADAARCAILFLATGDRRYADKGYRYLMLVNEFTALAERSKIMAEWEYTERLCALTAYDWLRNALTPEQRRAFLEPMLRHIEFMRDPGFPANRGNGVRNGNYGEPGLWWYAGLAAAGDGIADDLAERFLLDGWKLNTRMMDYRDKLSGGKGLLINPCVGYSFGYYPWTTNHFLHTLQTACNIDGTKFWSQPREYANYFNWMLIPVPSFNGHLTCHGWGDVRHIWNILPVDRMYTHLAYSIHLYGDSDTARALLSLLPPQYARIADTYPWTVFILTGFDPDKRFAGDVSRTLSPKLAETFPSCGLVNMRSGMGPDDTYASIKCGGKIAHHQHYDQLAFIIYKQGFQALDTGSRGNALHHRMYYPQTIAHNSLLIRMKDEPLPLYWYSRNAPQTDWSKAVCDGGQNRMTGGRSLGMEQSPWHVMTAGDATACYSGKKCREAVRQFVYVKPDYFVIYDRLTSVEPGQEKVFLLHTRRRPESWNGVFRSNAGTGSLFLRTVLPENARTEIIGGPDKEFWTNGSNYSLDTDMLNTRDIQSAGGIEKTNLGTYRMEVTPGKAETSVRFLTVLQAADGKVPAMIPVQKIAEKDWDGVRFTTREGITATVKFRRSGRVSSHIRLEKDGRLLLESPQK